MGNLPEFELRSNHRINHSPLSLSWTAFRPNEKQHQQKCKSRRKFVLAIISIGFFCLRYSRSSFGTKPFYTFSRNIKVMNFGEQYLSPNNSVVKEQREDLNFDELYLLHNDSVVEQEREHLNQTILPGNHVFILPPESRIGPNGEIGYVQDPKWHIKNPQYPTELQLSEEVCLPPGQGFEKPEGYQSLVKILVKIRNHLEMSRAPRNVSVLCAIYTYADNAIMTEAVLETWGKRCDGIFMASSESSETTGHTHLPSKSQHGFEYSGMYQRVRTMMAYLYDNFLNSDYDYFHFCGDDTYLIVDNLKEFLASERVQNWENLPGQHVFAGFWGHWGPCPYSNNTDGKHYFLGGPGYTLSRKALKAYVEGPLQNCDWIREDLPNEDVLFSRCLEEKLPQPKPMLDTRDAHGAHRYHHMDVYWHSHYSYPNYNGWDGNSQVMRQSLDRMERHFGFRITTQQDYISNSSIAFHKHSADDLRRYELLLYGDGKKLCGSQFDSVTAVAVENPPVLRKPTVRAVVSRSRRGKRPPRPNKKLTLRAVVSRSHNGKRRSRPHKNLTLRAVVSRSRREKRRSRPNKRLTVRAVVSRSHRRKRWSQPNSRLRRQHQENPVKTKRPGHRGTHLQVK